MEREDNQYKKCCFGVIVHEMCYIEIKEVLF